MVDILDERRYGVIASTPVLVTVLGTNIQLVEAPLSRERDTATTEVVVPDEDASHFVVHVGWSASGSGQFFLHDGDNQPKGQRIYFGSSSGDTVPMHIEMTKSAPIYIDVPSLSGGNLSVYVKYYTKRDSFRKHATAYEDA